MISIQSFVKSLFLMITAAVLIIFYSLSSIAMPFDVLPFLYTAMVFSAVIAMFSLLVMIDNAVENVPYAIQKIRNIIRIRKDRNT